MKQLQQGFLPSLYLEVYQQTQQFFATVFKVYSVKNNKSLGGFWQDIFGVSHIFQYWLQEIFSEPNKILSAQINFNHDLINLGQQFQQALAASTPLKIAKLTDKRFHASIWQEEPVYQFLAQAYLLLVQHCMQFIAANPSGDAKIHQQITFFTKQYLDALAPSNYILTNPEVMQHTSATQGENLIKGMTSFFTDWQQGNGYPNIQMTDMSAFEIGKNIATTPGKIVFKNRLFELIQYSPVTAQTHAIPILFIPPCINKYYILDLSEKNSLVKWVVEQGLTVFMISWVNPDEVYQNTDFEDYVVEGVITAVNEVQKITGAASINTLGFCIGGTLLTTAMSYLQAKRNTVIHSATFLATLIDFAEVGDLAAFIDEPQLQALENRMAKEGYLDGRLLRTIFNLLRANELFWPYFINNYLKGDLPQAFDLFFWNCDSVNLPKKMASFYLRNMYLKNNLIKKHKLSIKGTELDLSQISQACYFLATEFDHIAPWQSAYQGTKILAGQNTFVLGGSGHIAGIINPPLSRKYGYRVLATPHATLDAQQWYGCATKREGSWWDHWIDWLKPRSGKLIPAKKPNGEQAAPGEYVKKRL